MTRFSSTIMTLGLLLSLAACDGGGGGSDGGTHTGTDGATISDGSLSDGSTQPPPDGGTVQCDPPPTPVVAGTPETDALANAAARCGQTDFAWLHDASLGHVSDIHSTQRQTTGMLTAAASAAGVMLPRPLEHDVELSVFTYTTQDRGQLIDATAAVAYPRRATGESFDTILLLHGTSGFKDGCGVSMDLAMRTLAAVLASWGHIVVLPDYIGLKTYGSPTGFPHPYLVGQPTAIASLDAVRAALSMSPENRGGTCMSTRFVTMGGSQGGHAALWVDRLAPYYARELDLVGVVATVPPSDMVAQAQRALTMIVDATSNTVAFYGASSSWYGLGDRLSEIFVPPWDTDVPAALASDCSPSVDPPSSLDQLFTSDLLSAASAGTLADFGPWGCMVAESGLPTTSVTRQNADPDSYGILMVNGGADPLVNTPIERASFQTMCEAGIPIRYLECAGAGHVETTLWSLPETLAFMEARLAGETFARPTDCTPPAAVTCMGTPAGG